MISKDIIFEIQEYLTHKTGSPVQFGGSNTFNKEGIPSVGMAPESTTNRLRATRITS